MSNQLKLLVLTHNYPRRAGDHAGVFIALLMRHLVPLGIRPIVLAPHDPGAVEEEELDGVLVRRFRYADRDENEDIAYRGNMQNLVLGSVTGPLRFKRFLDRWRRAALQTIDEQAIDIVGGHWLVPSGMVMKTIASRRRLPMVLSSHGTDIRLTRKYAGATYRYFKSFCRGLHRWTFVSSFLRDSIASLDPKVAPRLEVLPLPHDESVFYRDDAVPPEPGLVVAVTRFTAQKRVDYLIKAFALVSEKLPSARLEIYGTGPLESTIRELIRKFGLEERVELRAPIPQERLREVYNRASTVVLNSYQEGFGLALSEAMLCGTAVIGTNSGGIPDIIEHEHRGLLVEPDNSAALAESIVRMLSDNRLQESLAENGYVFAHEHYAARPLAERYAAILREAVGK